MLVSLFAAIAIAAIAARVVLEYRAVCAERDPPVNVNPLRGPSETLIGWIAPIAAGLAAGTFSAGYLGDVLVPVAIAIGFVAAVVVRLLLHCFCFIVARQAEADRED